MNNTLRPLVRSSRWTGIPDGWRFGFRSTKDPKNGQLPLFMTWQEYYDKTGEVTYATVLFTTHNLGKRILWRCQDRFRQLIKMVCGYDQSKCWVCKGDTYVYPSNPFKRAYCVEHCPEHDFAYERDMREWCCQKCGEFAPHDFWAYHNY